MMLLLPALAAALVSLLGAEGFRRWAVRRRVLDLPNERSSHVVPTPRGGGVGIVAGFYVGFSVWLALGGELTARSSGWLLGALLIAAVSLVDDLRGLPAAPRLITHGTAAILVTGAGVQGGDPPLWLALPLAFVWVTVVTNLYNFMDGVDGLSAAQAIVAGAAFGVAGLTVGNGFVSASGFVIAAASAGFLVHNLPPARLFMGDVSSTFLGFAFAGLALLGNLGVGGAKLPLEFGLLVLAPFLFDGSVTLGRRMLRGERWYAAHRSHFYQRLVRAGLSHGQVTATYTLFALIAALAALARIWLTDVPWLALDAAAFAPMLVLVSVVRRLERGHGLGASA